MWRQDDNTNKGAYLEVSSDSNAEVAPQQGIIGSTWNLLNSIIGAPMITIPYYVAVCGWSFGFVLLWLFALMSFATLVLEHKLARDVGAKSLDELCTLAFGSKGSYAFNISTFLYNYGSFIGGLLIIGDTVPHLLRHLTEDYHAVRTWTMFLTVAATTPFAMRSDIAHLSFLGVLCFSACMLLTLCLMYMLLHEHSPNNGDASEALTWPERGDSPRLGFLHALGGFTYLFTCQDVAFPIANALTDNSTYRFSVVSLLTMILATSLLTAAASSAAMLFGSDASRMHDNVLANFAPPCPREVHDGILPSGARCSTDGMELVITNLCRGIIVFAVLASTPQSLYMPRQAVQSLLVQRLLVGANPSVLETSAKITTLLLILVGLIVALLTTSLSGVFSLVGGVAGTVIATILPCSAWIKLADAESWPFYRAQKGVWLSLFGIGVFAIGSSVLGTFYPRLIPGAFT